MYHACIVPTIEDPHIQAIVVTHLLIADVKFPDHILLMNILRLQSDLQLAELNILILLQNC